MEYEPVPNHEDKKRSKQLSQDAVQLLELLDQIAYERETVRHDLDYVHELIDSLESQLTGYDTLISQAQSDLMRITGILEEFACFPAVSPVADIGTDLAWIEDTWLCSSTNSALLREAEMSWLTGYPQSALNAISSVLTKNTGLDWDEAMKFRLLMAAILYSTGVHHESSYIVDNVLRRCEEHFVLHHVQAKEVSGVASFIKGKLMMTQQNWKAAYQAFADALQTPGYHAKAQKYQREAVRNHMREKFRREQHSPLQKHDSDITGLQSSQTSRTNPERMSPTQTYPGQECTRDEPEFFLDLVRRCPE